ncbi:ANTAR domain-containing protein [Nonomuraea typhae]|uniref:ANTAR domain-containing protein n=1 Tax=Nonomuraea typhae TaxID=2603600 RepID=A0ABW7Z5T9_9ACTN
MHIDEEALLASLKRLRSEGPDPSIGDHLARIVQAVDEIFGYDGAGLMFADETRTLRYLIATDEPGRSLERAQAEVGQGPCMDAYLHDTAVTTADARADARWPLLAALLHPRVRAVAGVPVRLAGGPVGSLNVYRAEPIEWDATDVQALHSYAKIIEQVVASALAAEEHGTLAKQLQYALDYRVLIERAIGFLMGRLSFTADEAFTALRKRARDNRRRIVDVAAEVLGRQAP